jgi:protein TonB
VTQALKQSIGIHLGIVGLSLLLFYRPQFSLPSRSTVDFEVFEFPKTVSPNAVLNPKAPPATQAPSERAVFGLNRNAITAEGAANDSAAELKLGNTVAKEQDDLKLDDDDPSKLPIPADEFLVTQQPRLKSEVRIPYPPEARKAGIEGRVVMDLLIDKTGSVRKVELVRGPGGGLDEAAIEAVRQFEFLPAEVQGQPVAVKIRYSYIFRLDAR